METRILEQLKNLYRTGFPEDSESVVSAFFSRVVPENAAYVLADGKICSAGYIMEKPSVVFGKKEVLPYLSALSTHTHYRGQRKIKTVISELLSRLFERGAYVCALYPFDHFFYKRYGFSNVSFCAEKIIAGRENYAETVYMPDTEIPTALLKKIVQLETAFKNGFDNYLIFGEQEVVGKIKEFFLEGLPLRIYSDENGVFAYCFTQNRRIYHYATSDLKKFASCKCLAEYTYFDFCTSATPYLQARIVNAKRALCAAPYAVDFNKTVRLHIMDGLMQENNITVEIKVKNGKAEVTTVDGIFDLTLDISELTTLLLEGDGNMIKKQKNLFTDQY